MPRCGPTSTAGKPRSCALHAYSSRCSSMRAPVPHRCSSVRRNLTLRDPMSTDADNQVQSSEPAIDPEAYIRILEQANAELEQDARYWQQRFEEELQRGNVLCQ